MYVGSVCGCMSQYECMYYVCIFVLMYMYCVYVCAYCERVCVLYVTGCFVCVVRLFICIWVCACLCINIGCVWGEVECMYVCCVLWYGEYAVCMYVCISVH